MKVALVRPVPIIVGIYKKSKKKETNRLHTSISGIGTVKISDLAKLTLTHITK